jgi:glutamate-1-semialdehyde 2,1-aminomutase
MDFETAFAQAKRDYLLRTSSSQKVFEKAGQVMPGGDTRTTAFYKPYPLSISRAEGPTLYDADGNAYTDFLNNYTAMIHGHAHPAIAKNVQAALALGTAYAAVIPEQLQLAGMICERVPGIEMLRFCNSGTEATMFAVRAARAFTDRSAIIKMEGGYHGTHETVEFSIAPPHRPGLPPAPLVPVPASPGISVNVSRDVYIAPFNNLDAIESILRTKANEIAAILVEPVMGVAGVIPPQPGYLAGLRQLADRYGVLLIFDEVQTLRLGRGGAQGLYQVTPDLTALAKIIGGGFPVGAFGGRAEIMALFDPNRPRAVSQGGTFNGNRITMAAGIAALEMLDEAAIAQLDTMAAELEARMSRSIRQAAVPVSITRAGSLLNVHFTERQPTDYASTYSPHQQLAGLVHLELLNRGIFTAPRGMWNLSTVMNQDHLAKAADAFADVMQLVARLV